jgi:hypothetical protein
MTLGAGTPASTTLQGQPFNVFAGYYRMVGAVNTGSGGFTSLLPFSQDNDTFYLTTPAETSVSISSGSVATLTFPSLPTGISVEAFGRCVGSTTGSGTTAHVLIYSPSQTAMPTNAHGFPTVPGYAVQSLSPDSAFSFRAWTDSTKSLLAVADNGTGTTAALECMLDGWKLARSQ